MKRIEHVHYKFLTSSLAELKAAEKRKARLERAGYTLVRETPTKLIYRKGKVIA